MEPITIILLYIFAALCIAAIPSLFSPRPLLRLSVAPVCRACGRGWAT